MEDGQRAQTSCSGNGIFCLVWVCNCEYTKNHDFYISSVSISYWHAMYLNNISQELSKNFLELISLASE